MIPGKAMNIIGHILLGLLIGSYVWGTVIFFRHHQEIIRVFSEILFGP